MVHAAAAVGTKKAKQGLTSENATNWQLVSRSLLPNPEGLFDIKG
jgi:hypothetical protein